jgi:Protein of unknown function (DUF2652)/Polyketide cyclase / dehydrase and lipid transport
VPFGTFLLADISGYSRYLDESGLQHASSSAAKLLNAIIDANRKRWKVANLEGDAVFLVHDGRVPPGELLPFVTDLFAGFYDRVLDISQDIDCGCGACGGVNRLTLKFLAHAGHYEEREIGGRAEVIGADVVIVHRLLKPDVGRSEYLLMTDSYLGGSPFTALPTTPGVLPLEEPVPFVVADLTPVRMEIDEQRSMDATARAAVRRLDVTVAAPAERVWEAVMTVDGMRAWSGASDVLVYPALAGAVGTSYRWILPDGYEFGQLLIAIDPSARCLTLRRDDVPGAGFVHTTYSVQGSDGSSVVTCAQSVARRGPLGSRRITRIERQHPDAAAAATLERLKGYCESSRPADEG